MLEEILVHTLELAERGGVLGGWILEIVVRQPDMLSRAGKGAKEGKTPGVGRIRRSVPCNDVVGDAKSPRRGTRASACPPKRGPAGSTSCRHPGCPSSGGRLRSCGQRAAAAQVNVLLQFKAERQATEKAKRQR